jgi:hypothetical protein
MSDLNCSEPGLSAAVIDVRPITPHVELVRWPASSCPDVNDSFGHTYDVYVRQTQREVRGQLTYAEVRAVRSGG